MPACGPGSCWQSRAADLEGGPDLLLPVPRMMPSQCNRPASGEHKYPFVYIKVEGKPIHRSKL